MAIETVKRCSDEKGFGFITSDDRSNVYVHHLAIGRGGYRSLTEGANVLYEAEAGEKGPEAVTVQRV